MFVSYIAQSPPHTSLRSETLGRKKKEKAAFFTMLDALITKKKLRDSLTNTLAMAHS
jgi:hypothetical protein